MMYDYTITACDCEMLLDKQTRLPIFCSSFFSFSCRVWPAAPPQPSAQSYPSSWPFQSLDFPGCVPSPTSLGRAFHSVSLDIFKPIFAWRFLSYQVIKLALAVWMNAPSSPSFTTPPTLSSLQTVESNQLWVCTFHSILKWHASPC